MQNDSFDYELPTDRIAQHPPKKRGASRLLHIGKTTAAHDFSALPELLAPGDLLVLNNSRVIPARLEAKKESGGRAEILIERIHSGGKSARALIRANHPPPPGGRLYIGEFIVAVSSRDDSFFELTINGGDFHQLLAKCGETPLPPYIRRPPNSADAARYQTVFARCDGSVAAPTAGLHFTRAMLADIKNRGIQIAYLTLHVGAGTFLPIRKDAPPPPERFIIPQKTADAINATRRRGGRIVAVGTTAMRALESAADKEGIHPMESDASVFIRPGFLFRAADALLTNFHLPNSPPLILVCAFGGINRMRDAYKIAAEKNFLFYSYGDAMLIYREPK